jgi:tetratricopeptide (TPR) repeat protein
MEAGGWLDLLGWNEEQISDLRYTAYMYIREGVYDVALTFLDAIAILAPPLPYDLQTLGALYLQKGDGLKALDYLDRAVKMEPSHWPSQLNRAKALFMLGYQRQGILLATDLEKCPDRAIASQASAILLAYE